MMRRKREASVMKGGKVKCEERYIEYLNMLFVANIL